MFYQSVTNMSHTLLVILLSGIVFQCVLAISGIALLANLCPGSQQELQVGTSLQNYSSQMY